MVIVGPGREFGLRVNVVFPFSIIGQVWRAVSTSVRIPRGWAIAVLALMGWALFGLLIWGGFEVAQLIW
jgi:hypothetical protein